MGQTIRQPDSTTAGACLLANKAFAVACAVFVIALASAGCGEEETPPPPADAPSSATAPADAVPDAEPASSPVSDPEPATHTKSPPEAPEPPGPTSTSLPPTEPATTAVEPDGEDALLSRIDREIAGLPDHLREPMEEIRHLERTARFSEAFREARQLFAEAEDYEHQQFLTATLRRLREARQEAVSLRFGIDELGQPASRRRRVAGQELLEAGPVGMALLREAVLERSADVAGQAARLLALADDPLAAPVLAKRLRETEDAELRNALLEAMARLAGDLPPQLVREFYRQVREGERFERLAEAEVVAEFLQKGAAGDEKTFNKLMGDDDAYAWLKELVKDAQLSGEPRLVEWAARMAERFELMIMRDLALWLAPGQGVKTDESGRVTRWADQSGAAHHAVQPSDGSRPTFVAAADGVPAHLAFEGNDYLAIEQMHYEEAGAIEDVSVLLWFRTRDDTAGVVDFDRSETWSLGIAFHRGDRNAGRLSWDTTAETSKTHDMLSPGSVADDAWRQAVVSYDASRGRKRIYVDGVLVAEQYAYPARTRLGSGATRYGFVGDGSEAGGFNAGRNNRYFVGDIAELAIWHRALSGGEVRSHYRMRSRLLP